MNRPPCEQPGKEEPCKSLRGFLTGIILNLHTIAGLCRVSGLLPKTFYYVLFLHLDFYFF